MLRKKRHLVDKFALSNTKLNATMKENILTDTLQPPVPISVVKCTVMHLCNSLASMAAFVLSCAVSPLFKKMFC